MIEKFKNITVNFCLIVACSLFFCLTGCEKPPAETSITFKSDLSNIVVLSGNKTYKVPKKLIVKPIVDNFFIAKKDGFEEKWFTVAAPQGKNVDYKIELKPLKTLVLIESDPKGAEVVFNDQIVGSTPCILKQLKNGDYKLFLNKLGYTQQEVRWSIKNSRPKLIKVKLRSNFGILKITSQPSGAKITASQKILGRTPLEQNIKSGIYDITIEKDGFAKENISMNVIAEKTAEKNIKLKELPGDLEVTTSIKKAKITFNDNVYNAPLVLKEVPAGTYEIKVTGYNVSPQKRRIKILPGRVLKEHFKMVSNTGSIDILVTTPGVTVFLDGKKAGKIKASKTDKNIADVFTIDNVSEGIHKIRLFHKLARPKDKTFTVNIQKNITTYTKRITIWVANCKLKMKGADAAVIGYFKGESPSYILFMKSPGITRKINKSDIESMKVIH